MDVCGIHQLVQVQLVAGIYPFYSGAVQTNAHGMNGLVQGQLVVGIS
jgi:hypothetical protein